MGLKDLISATEGTPKEEEAITKEDGVSNLYGDKRIMCFMRWGEHDDWSYNIIDIDDTKLKHKEKVKGMELTDEELEVIGNILLNASKRVREEEF